MAVLAGLIDYGEAVNSVLPPKLFKQLESDIVAQVDYLFNDIRLDDSDYGITYSSLPITSVYDERIDELKYYGFNTAQMLKGIRGTPVAGLIVVFKKINKNPFAKSLIAQMPSPRYGNYELTQWYADKDNKKLGCIVYEA